MQVLFSYSPTNGGFSGFTTVNSVSKPVTVRACASTFDRPQKPIAGAVVRANIEVFTNGPPVTEALVITDPFTGANVSSVTTGPSGCATFNVTRTGGWSTGPPSTIKGNITSGSNTESFFAGSVNVFIF